MDLSNAFLLITLVVDVAFSVKVIFLMVCIWPSPNPTLLDSNQPVSTFFLGKFAEGSGSKISFGPDPVSPPVSRKSALVILVVQYANDTQIIYPWVLQGCCYYSDKESVLPRLSGSGCSGPPGSSNVFYLISDGVALAI